MFLKDLHCIREEEHWTHVVGVVESTCLPCTQGQVCLDSDEHI